jgi:16S rRNA (cytidine1402-2'-O)-methyltransferase
MPGVSDPGALLVAYAQEHKIAYDVLPGANAVLSAYVASGFISTQFLFFGFLPHKTKEKESLLFEVLESGYVSIVYEAPHRLRKLLEIVIKISPERELFLAKELTKKYQKFYKGKAKELLEQLPKEIKGEWVVVFDKSKKTTHGSPISVADIEALDLPKKQKAKLLSKLTGENTKELYKKML